MPLKRLARSSGTFDSGIPRPSSDLEIPESNVPDERAKRFNGIYFIALSANEPQTNILVGIFWEPGGAIGGIIVTGVFEGVEAHVTMWRRPSDKRPDCGP